MEEHQTSFLTLKQALTTTLMLSYPDLSKEFVLETDASVKGLDAVLSQVSDY